MSAPRKAPERRPPVYPEAAPFSRREVPNENEFDVSPRSGNVLAFSSFDVPRLECSFEHGRQRKRGRDQPALTMADYNVWHVQGRVSAQLDDRTVHVDGQGF